MGREKLEAWNYRHPDAVEETLLWKKLWAGSCGGR